jgi:hypothetical protein
VEWDVASIIWNARILDGDEETAGGIVSGYERAGGRVDERVLRVCLAARAAVMSAWYPVLYPEPDEERRMKLRRRFLARGPMPWLCEERAMRTFSVTTTEEPFYVPTEPTQDTRSGIKLLAVPSVDAVAKLAVEKYLEYMHRAVGLPFTAIRQTNSYGRRDNDFFVTEQIITQMLKNPTDCFLGYKTPYRNFIFISKFMPQISSTINRFYKF